MMFDPISEETKAKYRAVFGTPTGKEVLAHMMVTLDEPSVIQPTETAVALKNYAEYLWACLGLRDDVSMRDYVSKMFELLPDSKE